MKHIMLIQSCYTDFDLSRRRLAISKVTSIPSLSYQSQKPVVHIVVNPNDPATSERIEAYRGTGCEVQAIERNEWKLYGENWQLPAGRKVVSRIDDDDVIAADFCKRTAEAGPDRGEMALIWPVGYVLWRNRCYQLRHQGNQFVSIATDGDKDPHQQKHWTFVNTMPFRIVSNQPGWIWIRHGDAATSTLRKYRTHQVNRIDSRIPINLRAVERVIAASGTPSANYREHHAQSGL